MKKNWLRKIILSLIVIPLLFGCGGKKEKGLKTIEGDPEILYKQGLAQFNKRQYLDALKKFEELKSSFPDSPPYTLLAELKIADSHFFKKDYVEAIAAYEEFKKIHPTHEEIPYVQFQIGMSHFNQMLSLDRDQTSAKKALSSFEYLIANYPPSLFSEKTREKVAACKKRLADHEFYIGDFYYRKEKFQAAASRFEELLEKFPKIAGEDKTLFLLGKSYLELDQMEKARGTFTKIINEYPKSPHFKETRAILNRGLKEKKASRKAKALVAKKEKGEITTGDSERVVLARYEEEGKKAASLGEEKQVEVKKADEKIPLPSFSSEAAKPIPSKEETKKVEPPSLAAVPMEEDRGKVIPQDTFAFLPGDEPQKSAPPKSEPQAEVKPEGEEKRAALPNVPTPSKEQVKREKEGLSSPLQEAKLGDTAYPIEITSDRVETYSRENLIVFKGNVTARQKDMVIYADSIEAVIIEDGKGIEKIIAAGNVKIQQGLRVANSQKAIFYNLDKKVVLTGDPKVWEGNNVVSGDEIVFDIEKDRLEVKGGSGGRGKARIHPREETEKGE